MQNAAKIHTENQVCHRNMAIRSVCFEGNRQVGELKYYPYDKSLFSHAARHLMFTVQEKNVVLKGNSLKLFDL